MICHKIKINRRSTKQERKKKDLSMLNFKLGIMKKRQLLTLTMGVLILLFMGFSARAQEHAPWNDMTGTATDAIDDSVVVNTTVPYYVEPDPVLNNLNTQYDPGSTNASQGINSTFNWSSTGDVTFTPPTGDADAPYREVTFGTAANDVPVTVVEESANGCGSGTGTTETVDVIAEPGFTVGSQDFQVCDGGTGNITISSIQADQIANASSYYFLLDIEKQLYESDESTELAASPAYTHADTVIAVSTADGSDIVLLQDYSFSCGTDGGKKVITKYVFDFTNNLGGDNMAGLNHHISRKGDFLDLAANAAGDGKVKPDLSATAYDGTEGYPDDETRYTWYGQGAGSITVTVYPTPTTGNIYHVPNTFEQ